MDYYLSFGAGPKLNLGVFWDLSQFLGSHWWLLALLCLGVAFMEWTGRLKASPAQAAAVRLGLAALVAVFIGAHGLKDWLL